ncbi:unnamed protein product [Cyclocybe aegerita]|uniref:DUF7918 domain-containing protein n=1 Tax=Cyclocybe aegerita TaxID=1973307 RepID=A0A8S0XUT8_CYCAE|nr:unnamed protein product [Cyclocybe aegerita]
MTKTCLNYAGIRTSVELAGIEAEYYGVSESEIEGERHIMGWIASDAEKAFRVRVENGPLEDFLRKVLFLDGVIAQHTIKLSKEPSTVIFDHVMTSHKTKRSFKFSPLDTTDDDAVLDSFTSADPGSREIIVKVCSVENPIAYNWTSSPFTSRPEIMKIHETLAKGKINHHITYGEETSAFASENSVQFKAKAHLVTFVFKYRPLATLRRMGVIPQPGPVARTKRPRERKLSCIQVKEEGPPAAAIGNTLNEREKFLMLELESLRNENDQLRAENRRVRKKLKKSHNPSADLPDDVMDLS